MPRLIDHIAKLQKDLDKLLDVKKDDAGEVLSSFKGSMEKLDKNSLEYLESLPKLKRINAYEKVIADAGANEGFGFVEGQMTTLTKKAARKEDAPADSIQAASRALFDARATREYTMFGVSYEGFKNIAIKGAAGVALVTMTDRSRPCW